MRTLRIKNSAGFSRIALISVIAVIVVVLAIAIYQYSTYVECRPGITGSTSAVVRWNAPVFTLGL
jgi:Tfp pilus assembly protein PilE